MLLTGLLSAFALCIVILLFVRQWVTPWRELEELLRTIGKGQYPRTFLLSGNRRVRQIGPALEELLLQQQRLDRQLSKDAKEMHAVFNALADGLLVLDANSRVQFTNPAFEKIFGKRGAVGTPLVELVHDLAVVTLMRKVFDTAKAATAEVTSPDRRRQLQLNAVPLVGDSGVAGVIALFHDISDLKRVDEIRRDFVANVSHELRTPLSIFRGNLEALLDGTELDSAERQRIYRVMKRHSDRINLLVDDLLSLARLEARETTLQLTIIDLADFLPRVCRDWTQRCSEKHLHLEARVPEKLTLEVDEMRLEEMLHNLLDNAIKYSSPGGQIIVQGEARDSEVVISVSDQGVGIPAEDLPRIFERFYRVDRARGSESPGTGLGLSIVKHIALLHGGRVDAESIPGEGTRISVYLPRQSAAVTQT